MGIYEDVQKAHAIQKEITGSFFSGESTTDLVKRIETNIQKGKKAEIGEVRMYSGKPWVKVSSTGNPNKDWQPQKSVKGNAVEKPEEKKEENEVKVLDSKGNEKKTHEVDTDINGVEVKPGDKVVWHHKKNGVNQYTKGVVSNEMDSFGHLMVEFEGSKILSGSVPYKTGVTVLPKEGTKEEVTKEGSKLLNYGEALEIVRKYDPNYTPKKMDDMEFHVGVAHTADGGWKVDEEKLKKEFPKVENKSKSDIKVGDTISLNDDVHLVSLMNLVGKTMKVLDIEMVNFASGEKEYYVVEVDGKKTELNQDMVHKTEGKKEEPAKLGEGTNLTHEQVKARIMKISKEKWGEQRNDIGVSIGGMVKNKNGFKFTVFTKEGEIRDNLKDLLQDKFPQFNVKVGNVGGEVPATKLVELINE